MTYLLGRDSPCFKQYSDGKMDNWDMTRPTPTNIHSLLEMTHNIYKMSQSAIVKSEDETKNVYNFINI